MEINSILILFMLIFYFFSQGRKRTLLEGKSLRTIFLFPSLTPKQGSIPLACHDSTNKGTSPVLTSITPCTSPSWHLSQLIFSLYLCLSFMYVSPPKLLSPMRPEASLFLFVLFLSPPTQTITSPLPST